MCLKATEFAVFTIAEVRVPLATRKSDKGLPTETVLLLASSVQTLLFDRRLVKMRVFELNTLSDMSIRAKNTELLGQHSLKRT